MQILIPPTRILVSCTLLIVICPVDKPHKPTETLYTARRRTFHIYHNAEETSNHLTALTPLPPHPSQTLYRKDHLVVVTADDVDQSLGRLTGHRRKLVYKHRCHTMNVHSLPTGEVSPWNTNVLCLVQITPILSRIPEECSRHPYVLYLKYPVKHYSSPSLSYCLACSYAKPNHKR